MENIKYSPGLAPGILIAVLIGTLCWGLSFLHPVLDPLVTGIIAGMLLGPLISGKAGLNKGCETASAVFIPLGIAAYGANLNFRLLPGIPPVAWLQLTVGVILIFVLAVWAGRAADLRDKTSLLIGVGTAICGASAIAISAAAIRAEKEDTSLALPSIAVWGVAGSFLYPALQAAFPLTETGYALLTGTTLQMTGVVKIAAAAGGDNCLALAMAVKMARVTMLLLIVPLMTLAVNGRANTPMGTGRGMPLAMIALIVVGALFSYVPPLVPLSGKVAPYAALFFTIALTSIGLSSDIRAVRPLLARGAAVALAAWAGCIAIFAAGYFLIGY